MFLHEHLWIQLLLALTILPSPLFFSGSNKQSQTRQQPHVPFLGKCYNLQTQLFMTPDQVFLLFFIYLFILQHLRATSIYLLRCSPVASPSFLLVVFYLWNTETMNRHYYAAAIVWQIEVTTSISSGNDGDK